MKLSQVLYFSFILVAITMAPSFTWADENADAKLDEMIQKLSQSNDQWARYAAAEKLGSDYKANEKAFNALCDALKHEYDGDVRESIVVALGNHENPKAFEPLKNRLELSYDPKNSEYFELRDIMVLGAIMRTLGQIHNPDAVDYLFSYFKRQPDSYFLGPEWWPFDVKAIALQSMLTLSKSLSDEELRTLYLKYHDLLKAKTQYWDRTARFDLKEMPKFSLQMAWFFLKTLNSENHADINTEIVNTMIRDWPTEWRQRVQAGMNSKGTFSNGSLVTVLHGKVDGQGKYFGRLGQFMLKDSSGRDIAQVHVDPSRINDVYRFHNQNVSVRVALQILDNGFLLWDNTYPVLLELQDVKLSQ